jgi:hypothetical protein
MKYLFIVALNTLLITPLFAQEDTVQSARRSWGSFHFVNGINFLRNEVLQENYKVKSIYFLGFGVRIGDPRSERLHFHLNYYHSRFTATAEVDNVKQDSSLALNQIVPSISFLLVKGKSFSIYSKGGYIHGMIKDGFSKLSKDTPGLKVGIGVQNKIFRNHDLHLDLDYDLMKPKSIGFRDYDVIKLSLGLYL